MPAKQLQPHTTAVYVLSTVLLVKIQVISAGEFEPHANAWMGWPDSGMLWREDAKPAQKQYADVAKAISQFEPVVMMANPEVCTQLNPFCTQLNPFCEDVYACDMPHFASS